MMMRFHVVVDREVVLAVVEPGAASDDLLELDHRVDRAHQNDVADVPRIDAGRELLRGGQNGRDGLLVVLEVAQVLLAELAIIGRDALAVVRILARLHLVDEVAHRQRMILRRAEDHASFRSGRSRPCRILTRFASRSLISMILLKSLST